MRSGRETIELEKRKRKETLDTVTKGVLYWIYRIKQRAKVMNKQINLGTVSTFSEVVKTRNLAQCRKCGGQGHLVGLGRLPDNGVCYRCWGSGMDPRPGTETWKEEVVENSKLIGYELEDGMSVEDVLAQYQADEAEKEAQERANAKYLWELFFPDSEF